MELKTQNRRKKPLIWFAEGMKTLENYTYVYLILFVAVGRTTDSGRDLNCLMQEERVMINVIDGGDPWCSPKVKYTGL